MLVNLSWRNVWRNKLRSLVVIASVIVGSWAVIFMSSFSTGLIKSFIDSSIQNEISHIQIHHPKFLEDKDIQYLLEDSAELLSTINTEEEVKAATGRIIVSGMLSSPKSARGIQVRGVDPVNEAKVTLLDQLIVEGEYLSEKKKNPILISSSMAKKLQVKLRSKIVLTFQDFDSEIVAGAFRVVGIFDSGKKVFDEMNCFIRQNDLSRLIKGSVNNAGAVQDDKRLLTHELAIYLKDQNKVVAFGEQLQKRFPSVEVQNYRQISPDVELFENQIAISSLIFMVIVMLALVFGIINTMLMAVLERYKELGVLMAIGMNKSKIFIMIVLETLMLAVVAAPIGLLVGYLSVLFFKDRGIDLSAFSAGMREFGMSEIVYPDMDPNLYIQLTIAVAITALLASIYPAYKAIKLKPLEAIRKL